MTQKIENITFGKNPTDVFALNDTQRITTKDTQGKTVSIIEQQVNAFNSGARPGDMPG